MRPAQQGLPFISHVKSTIAHRSFPFYFYPPIFRNLCSVIENNATDSFTLSKERTDNGQKYKKSKVFFFEFHSVCDHSKNSETDGINKDNVLMIIKFT